MVKNVTVTKKLFLDWARSRYGPNVRFVRKGAVDFVLPDGTRVIVKRPIRGFIYFTKSQWGGLSDGDVVAVVDETKGVIGMIPFSKLRDGEPVDIGNYRFTVIVEKPAYATLRIRCSREIYEKFGKIAVEIGGYENALRYLLDLYELYGRRPSPRVF